MYGLTRERAPRGIQGRSTLLYKKTILAMFTISLAAATAQVIDSPIFTPDLPISPWTDTNLTVKVTKFHQSYPYTGKATVQYTVGGVPSRNTVAEITINTDDASATFVQSNIVAGVTSHVIDFASSFGGALLLTNASFVVTISGSEAPGVQLWENGPCWAECNVGATSPEEYGFYFYINNDEDVATTSLGSPWRMPTSAEFSALFSNCTSTWTTVRGVSGRRFTGKGDYADRSIFLPAAGYYNDPGEPISLGEIGTYLSSTFGTSIFNVSPGEKIRIYLNFDSNGFWFDENNHYYRLSVRPVR